MTDLLLKKNVRIISRCPTTQWGRRASKYRWVSSFFELQPRWPDAFFQHPQHDNNVPGHPGAPHHVDPQIGVLSLQERAKCESKDAGDPHFHGAHGCLSMQFPCYPSAVREWARHGLTRRQTIHRSPLLQLLLHGAWGGFLRASAAVGWSIERWASFL